MWNVSMPIAYSNVANNRINNVNFKSKATVAKKALPYWISDCKTDREAFAHAMKDSFRGSIERHPQYIRENWTDILAFPNNVWAGSSRIYSATDEFAHLPLPRIGVFEGPSGKRYAIVARDKDVDAYLKECHSKEGLIKLSDVSKEYEIGYDPLKI